MEPLRQKRSLGGHGENMGLMVDFRVASQCIDRWIRAFGKAQAQDIAKSIIGSPYHSEDFKQALATAFGD
jgi:hypothetical protein